MGAAVVPSGKSSLEGTGVARGVSSQADEPAQVFPKQWGIKWFKQEKSFLVLTEKKNGGFGGHLCNNLKIECSLQKCMRNRFKLGGWIGMEV